MRATAWTKCFIVNVYADYKIVLQLQIKGFIMVQFAQSQEENVVTVDKKAEDNSSLVSGDVKKRRVSIGNYVSSINSAYTDVFPKGVCPPFKGLVVGESLSKHGKGTRLVHVRVGEGEEGIIRIVNERCVEVM